jgi:hypothetical protein
MERDEFTPMLGPADHLPVGSVEWSQRIANQLQIATDTVSYDVEHLVARSLKQVLSADPKPWAVWPEGKPFETRDAWARAVTGHHWEVLVQITNEFGGTEGKAIAVLADTLPEPWSSGEAKHVLDAALTIVTRLSGYEFDPPLDSDTRDEIMAYAIGAVGRRGSEGWVAWERGGERIMHPVAADDPYFAHLAEWFTRKGVERPEQVFFEVADAMNHEPGRLRARLREDAEGNRSASLDADPINRRPTP